VQHDAADRPELGRAERSRDGEERSGSHVRAAEGFVVFSSAIVAATLASAVLARNAPRQRDGCDRGQREEMGAGAAGASVRSSRKRGSRG
jgi:hypothetical protein